MKLRVVVNVAFQTEVEVSDSLLETAVGQENPVNFIIDFAKIQGKKTYVRWCNDGNQSNPYPEDTIVSTSAVIMPETIAFQE